VIKQQLSEINIHTPHILVEPLKLNTAVAIIYASYYALHNGGNEKTVLAILPVDHQVNDKQFRKVFEKAVQLTKNYNKPTLIGIEPAFPNVNYGHIETTPTKTKDIYTVNAFKEKPSYTLAVQYTNTDKYFWNSGMLFITVGELLNACKQVAPSYYNVTKAWKDDISPESVLQVYKKAEEQELTLSVDYAILEKYAKNIMLIKADKSLGWNDLGNWRDVEKEIKPDQHGNRWTSATKFVASQNCTVFNYTEKEVTLEHVTNLIVVVTKNGITIVDKNSALKTKLFLDFYKTKVTTKSIGCTNVSLINKTNVLLFAVDVNDMLVSLDNKSLYIQHSS
jgi:mannose-1-phosphate guanylyltransferase